VAFVVSFTLSLSLSLSLFLMIALPDFHGTNWYASSMMTAVEVRVTAAMTSSHTPKHAGRILTCGTGLQPWSGNYQINPVIWATAHVTQFTEIGWLYLQNNTGSGQLPQVRSFFVVMCSLACVVAMFDVAACLFSLHPCVLWDEQGGYYVTFVDKQTNNFTINIVKIDHDHASCTRPSLPSFSVLP
jgi:galactosylceramidase